MVLINSTSGASCVFGS